MDNKIDDAKKEDRKPLDSHDVPEFPPMLFEFILENRRLQWDIFKGMEQKAVQLILFSGIMIGLVLNLTELFPYLMDNMININIFNNFYLSYFFLIICFSLFIFSTFCGLKVIFHSIFLDVFTSTGFIKEEFEEHFHKYFSNDDGCLDTSSFSLEMFRELTNEIQFFKKINSDNSPYLKLGFLSFILGVVFISITIFTIF